VCFDTLYLGKLKGVGKVWRRFFISVAAMQEVLDSYLQFCNWRRAASGLSAPGATPAEVFHHA